MEKKYLYILVRTDMESLGRGKSVAQGAHAANAFTWDNIIMPALQNLSMNAEALEWSREAAGFGTTIALAATLKQMENAVTIAKAMNFPASLVKDPEYPLLDGDTFHIIPDVVTTAYIFGTKSEVAPFLSSFSLLVNDPV